MIACAAREHTSLFRKTVVILIAVFFADLYLSWIWSVRYYGHFYFFGVIVWLAALSVLRGGVVIWAVLQMARLQEGSRRIAEGDNSTPIDTQGMFWEFKKHAENINKIGDGIAIAVEQQMKSERFKTELITNVSHDIKTPLTSIINYVDLIKKEEITDPVLTEYVEVLDRQSARLKKLIEDLMEASKASTGNLTVHLEKCDAAVFLSQVVGEFQDRAHANDLSLIVTTPPEPVEIMADGRHLWRVFDNLLNNICKYAQPGTRVYISLEEKEGKAVLTFKNISRYQLNISGEELMERFVRGDSSRNTEGSGLGLSIAQSLTTLMNGTMDLSVDGDLFKVTLSFDAV
jgi:signal transduction histidine kinase